MKRVPTAQFNEFIDFFPVLDPPINLLPDIGEIPTASVPLPLILLESYILPIEGEETDDFTEYIPYGRIAGLKDIYALIYWKAGVMQYEFVLATFSGEGIPLSHAIIGGIRAEENGILHSVAVIHEDLTITIAEGVVTEEGAGNIDQTNTYQMSIQPSGQINYGVNEEDNEN